MVLHTMPCSLVDYHWNTSTSPITTATASFTHCDASGIIFQQLASLCAVFVRARTHARFFLPISSENQNIAMQKSYKAVVENKKNT